MKISILKNPSQIANVQSINKILSITKSQIFSPSKSNVYRLYSQKGPTMYTTILFITICVALVLAEVTRRPYIFANQSRKAKTIIAYHDLIYDINITNHIHTAEQIGLRIDTLIFACERSDESPPSCNVWNELKILHREITNQIRFIVMHEQAPLRYTRATENDTLRDSIILWDNTFNDVNQNLDILSKQINEHVDTINPLFEKVNMVEMNSILQFISLTLNEHKSFNNNLIKTLMEGGNERIFYIIEPQRIVSDLILINKNEGEGTRAIPVTVNAYTLKNIVQISELTVTLRDNILRFVLAVPITEQKLFSIFKAIPLPFVSNNQTWVMIPQYNYSLIKHESVDGYLSSYPMYDHEINDCKQLVSNKLLCKPSHLLERYNIWNQTQLNETIFNPDEINCDYNKINMSSFEQCNIVQTKNENVFVELYSENTSKYFIHAAEPFKLKRYCKNNTLETLEFNETKFFEIEKSCSLSPCNNNFNGILESSFTKHHLILSEKAFLNVVDENKYEQNASTLNKIQITKKDFHESSSNLLTDLTRHRPLTQTNNYEIIKPLSLATLFILFIYICVSLIKKFITKTFPINNPSNNVLTQTPTVV